MGPTTLPDPIEVAAAFTSVLENLGIRYLIGGSLASSVHGEPRSTNVLAILRVQGGRLDGSRLDDWAGRLGVSDLLERARSEAAPGD